MLECLCFSVSLQNALFGARRLFVEVIVLDAEFPKAYAAHSPTYVFEYLPVDRKQQALAPSSPRRPRVGVVSVDLDRLKEFNDTCGHEEGHLVSATVAARLRAALKAPDTVVCIGGDEPCVLTEGLEVPEGRSRTARRFRTRFQMPFMAGGNPHRLTASIGVSEAQDLGETADLLRHAAGRHVYRVKRSGNNGVVFPSATLGKH